MSRRSLSLPQFTLLCLTNLHLNVHANFWRHFLQDGRELALCSLPRLSLPSDDEKDKPLRLSTFIGVTTTTKIWININSFLFDKFLTLFYEDFCKKNKSEIFLQNIGMEKGTIIFLRRNRKMKITDNSKFFNILVNVIWRKF